MLTVLSSGLPVSAKNILNEAMNTVFGDTLEVVELTKSNLRSRVRLSLRSVETVLVILDGVSSDMCKDIENGLYSSDKYFMYSNDKELAEFLNNKYSINIVVEEDIEEVSSSEYSTSNYDEDYYKEKLKIKDDTIKNLETRINDLLEEYSFVSEVQENTVNLEDFENLKDTNINLNNTILELKSNIDEKDGYITDLLKEKESLGKLQESLENRLKRESSKYTDLVNELNDLKVIHSKQSGVLRDKESKIKELSDKVEKCEKSLKEYKQLEIKISEYEKILISKDTEISELNVDLQSKEKEVYRYVTELNSLKHLEGVDEKLELANNTIDTLNMDIVHITKEKDSLLKDLGDKDRVISQLSDNINGYEEKLSENQSEIESLKERIKNDDNSIMILNKENLELQNKVSLLEKTSNSDDDNESLIKEITRLQDKLSSISNSVFSKIGQLALPNSSMNVKVLGGNGRFENIRFAFSGNAESRKGTYKSLLNEFVNSKKEDRYLVVDLVSETSIDYVFKIPRVVPGMEWFRKGGSVQPYISNTSLKNVQVLSCGLGYINDSYFLCIDWAKRLTELNNSGYKVVLFCGDISNMIGRILHESFASFGESLIYVQGNAIGCRTIITNLRGLSNAKDSIVVYYDYNKSEQLQKFYDMVSKTNECKILSPKGNYNR